MADNDCRVLDRLFEVIEDRRGGDPDTSYTAALLRAGRTKAAAKVGEEAVETVIAATAGKDDEIVHESADLLYHLLVLWAACGIKPQAVWDKLASREGISGIEEKRSRSA
jgi:phosphoribosyl-ATP pyrophosphohydrolase